MGFAVDKNRFGELVQTALAELPDEFAAFLEEVPVEVRRQPTPEQLKSARVGAGGLLLGLYHGRPRTLRSVTDSGQMPDVIYIFQQPIEAICGDEEQLVRQVRTTVLHEIGHHFGMDEQQLRELGYG